MKLKEALKRVIKICPKGKDQGLYKAVRLISGDVPSVFASDGVCSILINVEAPLVDALISTTGLASAVKDSEDLGIVDAPSYVQLVGSSTYKVDKTDNLDYFPKVPNTPSSYEIVPGWWLVKKVFHAAANQKAGAALSVVNFNPEYVEAFDQVGLSRVAMDRHWKGFVPARLFKNWPGGTVAARFTEHHAFFMIGDELRIANLTVDGGYPDTENLVAGGKETYSCLPHTETLLETVKQATEISPINLVMLTAKEDMLGVQACNASGAMDTYAGVVPTLFKWGEPGQATVDGKYLQQTLKQCDTPRVKVSLGDTVDPLRIESGNLTECIWQRCWE